MSTPRRTIRRLAATGGALALLLGLGAANLRPDPTVPPPPPPSPPPAETLEPATEPASGETPPPDQGTEPAPAPLPPPPPAPALDIPDLDPYGPPLDEGDLSDGPLEVTVFLKDGRRFTGLLVERTPTVLVLGIEGIRTRFPAETVDRIRTMRPVLERYEEMRRAMGDDPVQIVKLADWLRAREYHALALAEIERALILAPANTEAKQLQLLITKQLELRERARATSSGDDPAAARAPEPHVTNQAQLDFPLLTPEQINLMKVYELDLKRAPRIVIKRDTIKRLLEQYRSHHLIPVTQEGREAIYRRTPKEIMELMFRVQARDLYAEITVVDQPESIRLFRDTVHRTWLINSCATNACHGGEEAGRLMLSNRRPNADASVYTNLLILERFRLPDGTPLLDYENPERSPLLQMALPRGDAVFRHPEVPQGLTGADGWRPVFRSTDDRRFVQATEWLRSMYRPRPEYPVEYTPPGSLKPVAPAPEPVAR